MIIDSVTSFHPMYMYLVVGDDVDELVCRQRKELWQARDCLKLSIDKPASCLGQSMTLMSTCKEVHSNTVVHCNVAHHEFSTAVTKTEHLKHVRRRQNALDSVDTQNHFAGVDVAEYETQR